MCAPFRQKPDPDGSPLKVWLFFMNEEDRSCWIDSYLKGGKFDYSILTIHKNQKDENDTPFVVILKLV